jgi:hypothetical protein
MISLNNSLRWMFAAPLLLLTLVLLAGPVGAQDTPRRGRSYPLMTPPSGGTDPGSSGIAFVQNNPRGPDVLTASFRNMAPNTCYALFLTSSMIGGSTPGSLVGQFCADEKGQALFFAVTEIVNAFVFTNLVLDGDGDGRTDGQGAGVIANGGFQVATPILRVYRAQTTTVPTVFSSRAGMTGGLFTMSSPPIR